jgi:hypothetical protein
VHDYSKQFNHLA